MDRAADYRSISLERGATLSDPRSRRDLRSSCQAPIAAMGIRDKPISAASPWQNCLAERLIGSIRRECVDHVVALGEQHLRRVLRSYARYYNEARTHRSLNKACLSGCHRQPLAVVFGDAHGRSPAWQSSVPTIAPRVPATFPDDAACAAYLEKARWSDGSVCPIVRRRESCSASQIVLASCAAAVPL